MRAALSRRILALLERHTPEWVRRLEIRILMNLAAESFRRPRQSVAGLPADEALRTYAAFTAASMAETEADPRRLYDRAFRLGRRLRRLTGLKDPADLQRLVFWLYRNLGITLQGCLPGKITVPACYFSGFYSPAQCALMSHVDAGIISGLFGGGTLRFTERLTEGRGRCRACFGKEGESL